MEPNPQKINKADKDISFREIAAVIWSGRIKIIVVTLGFTICSVLYALSLPNEYRASALLAPAQQDAGGLSGMLGQLGGLASLAGMSLGAGETSESKVAQQIMKSWSFMDGFITNNDLAVEVYAVEGWNSYSNTPIIDEDLYDETKKEWLVVNDVTGETGPPSSWQLYKAFAEKLVVSEDNDSGLVTVSVEHYSPLVAKEWVDMFVKDINRHMQERQVEKVSKNIEYLERQIDKASIAEMQGVLYTIIEEQIKAKMLAEASPEYAFVTVSSSMIPEKKSRPKRALIGIVGALFGAMLAVFATLVVHSYRGHGHLPGGVSRTYGVN